MMQSAITPTTPAQESALVRLGYYWFESKTCMVKDFPNATHEDQYETWEEVFVYSLPEFGGVDPLEWSKRD